MHGKNIITMLALLIMLLATATATPILNANTSIITTGTAHNLVGKDVCQKGLGKPGGVYVCPEPGWKPNELRQCEWIEPGRAWNDCHDFTLSQGLWRSIGPDYQGYCVIYSGFRCNTQRVLSIWSDGIRHE